MRVLQQLDLFQRPVKDSKYHTKESVKSVVEYIFIQIWIVEKAWVPNAYTVRFKMFFFCVHDKYKVNYQQ
jgi:hypothetical protein